MPELGKYPSLSWVRSQLRNNVVAPCRYKVLRAFIVGSEARGAAKSTSDLDIALIIPDIRGKTSLQVTENYQSKFRNDFFRPKWGGRIVDFQFFYAEDADLKRYQKIVIK